MDLNELQEVSIASKNNYKFLVAEISDDNGNKKLVLRAKDAPLGYLSHRGINEDLGQEAVGLHLSVLGGGLLLGSPDNTLTLSGSSTEFGSEPNREVTAQMLRIAFPTATVIVKAR